MSYAVVYQSQSGNTKRVAEAIAGSLPGAVEPVALGDAAAPVDADLLFVGFPIHGFGPAKEAVGFLKERCAGRRVALFVTHASPEDTPVLDEWLAKCREAAEDCELVGFFNCQGALAEPVKQHMLQAPDPNLKRWAETDQSQGQPDAGRLEKAREFAREVVATD